MSNAAGELRTRAEDYGKCYYGSHLGSTEDYNWDSPGWRAFFVNLADRIVSITNPSTVLDVGCAKGLLVQALAERQVDAHGEDISEHAIEASHPDVRKRLRVNSATTPIEGRWDLITCIEVLEHMSQNDADQAMDNMCAATDQILFSSGPADFGEPTHINVRPPADWAAAFAERGFYRRTDVDLGFLTPWAVLFESVDLRNRDLVYRYETYSYPMKAEVAEKRAALLEAHRTISDLEARAAQEAADSPLAAQLLDARRRLLTLRDHAIGAEAAAATAHAEAKRAEHKIAKLESDLEALATEIRELKQSERWRAGSVVVAPVASLKRMIRP